MTTKPVVSFRSLAEGDSRPSDDDEIRIGVSACLVGEAVRYDGGHKRDAFLTDTLARFVRFVPVCPEVEVGLGIPRETLRLERDGRRGTRLVATKSGADHTSRMHRFAASRVAKLRDADLCGFVLKKDSPSCGLERVRRYDHNGVPAREGRGLFAAALVERLPLLPVEEEGRLRDPALRENFLERVFAYRRLRSAFRPRWTIGDLVRFHTAEKLLLLAHDPAGYRDLGRLVAGAKRTDRRDLRDRYATGFMQAMASKATKGRHANVLQHMAGYFRETLSAEDRRELEERVEEFRRGLIPLIVPITLFRHHVRREGVAYLAGQTYLEPHPKELMLRNHV